MATNPTNLVSFARASSAARIQHQLKETEQQVDLSFANTGELYGKLMRAADEAGLHAADIHRDLVRAHNASGFLLKARWELQMVHQGCRNHLKKIDPTVVGWGDVDSPKMSDEAMHEGERLASS